jgi:hypothetical protein
LTNEPDFTNLVGDDGDPEELDRLRRVHEMLVAAGPPPELSPSMAHAPDVEESKVVAIGRRRPTTMIALAAALAVVTFLVGYAVADKRTAFSSKAEVPMHGIGLAHSARADIAIGSHDVSGNYPLQMTVQGLKPLPKGGWYELLLSKHGKPTLPCGTFRVDDQPLTIRLSVPYDLSDFGRLFDGWVVVKHVPKQTAAPIVLTT